ncbi:MAG: tape measure protein, partial [Clostridia bacterium]
MSSVDNRIVGMQFDNQQFERGVQTSIRSLDALKRGLDLDKSAKSLAGLEKAGRNFSLARIADNVDQVASKFSAMGILGVTAMQRVANSAIDTGKRLLSALTIDPVKTGFNEYELKMDSIRTIMASTGEELSVVNKYLNELNKYSDDTIYSFSDMTRNIGKFTNAGVHLKDAVSAIQGISNVAALSGANANEAERAMYNFAQALSAGHVKLMDWRSIELANMGTQEFKNQLIAT